jgi:hypothetical protein
MSALSPVRRSPAKRPRWLVVTLVSVSMLALFAIGFAAALFIDGSPSSVVATVDEVVQGSAESNAGATVAPEPCETTLVAPAEVLPRPDSIVVNVYNSTQRGGLAGTTAQELSQRGFRINKVENDPLGVSLRGVGEIRYGPNGAENAQLLQFYFPGAVMVDDGRSGPRVDISLGRGFEAMEDQALVAATLASPSPSLSGPGCPSE